MDALQSRRASGLGKQKTRISERGSKKSLGTGLRLQSKPNGSTAITYSPHATDAKKV
jgi:hypothetical protein